MRYRRLASVLPLLLTLGAAACAEAREERALPEVPVQAGEALQVEVDPAATDTVPRRTMPGTPGATPQTGDTL